MNKASINLESDNVSAAAPAIVQALARVNEGASRAYGMDDESAKAAAAFSVLFKTAVWLHPVSTGSAANALSLSVLSPSYGAIFCADVAHVETSESTAIAMHTGGAKLVPVKTSSGKMSATELDRTICAAGAGRQQKAQPAAVSITMATERGTVYTRDELAAICAVAKRHNLYIHLDGARLANSVVTLGCPISTITTNLGIDIVSFGASKNGTLNTDAIVLLNPNLSDQLSFRIRRGGQVWSKMRYAAAQLNAYIEKDLWLSLAANANERAVQLAEGLRRQPSVRILEEVEANIVLADLPERVRSGLAKDGILVGWNGERTRLVTAWSTTASEIAHVLESVNRHSLPCR